MKISPKKHLGQHFLTDKNTAKRIASAAEANCAELIFEIGGGKGILSEFFIRDDNFFVCDIDSESIEYLKRSYPFAEKRILEQDFLKTNLSESFPEKQISIIGNFPYNISSQIVFKLIREHRQACSLTGMFQKEVARRICSPHGSKEYGVLSVLSQSFFDAKYLFTVNPGAFHPPPKVSSGVIRMTRKAQPEIDEAEYSNFKKMVKAAFNHRRKMLRNSLSDYFPDKEKHTFLKLRPEQISVKDFVKIFYAYKEKV